MIVLFQADCPNLTRRFAGGASVSVSFVCLLFVSECVCVCVCVCVCEYVYFVYCWCLFESKLWACDLFFACVSLCSCLMYMRINIVSKICTWLSFKQDISKKL